MIKKILNTKFWLPVLLLMLVCLNWAGSYFHARIDLTDQKRFTLSGATKKILKKLDKPVTVDILLHGKLNSGFRQLASSTEDMLNEFKEAAGNKIHFEFVNPDDIIEGTNSSYADTIASMGLFSISLTSQVKAGQEQEVIYPFAVVRSGDTLAVARLYTGKISKMGFSDISSAEALLEYHLIDAITKVSQNEKPIVGYALGNGEPTDYSTYDLRENVLKPNYKLFTLDLNSPQAIPADFKALIVAKPTTGFSELAKLKLDQYVMNGGKLLMFIDRLNAEMDSLAIKNQVVALDRNLNLNDLLFNYGVRINADLVMDLQSDFLPFDVNGNGQYEFLPWNYFPVISSKGNHAVNKGLGEVSGRFVNSLDTLESAGITKTVLLSSSANARTIGSPAIISGTETVNAANEALFNKADIKISVLLEGKFSSMFANRLSTDFRDSLEKYNSPFLQQCIRSNKMIISGDGDIILNSISEGRPLPMGQNPYTIGSQKEVQFANRDFVLNCLDYLIDENNLSEAKAKDYTPRVLDPKKTEEEKGFWKLINLLLPVTVILLFALLFGWLRKRKYVKKYE